MNEFKTGDRVTREGEKEGNVWKVSTEAVHVLFDDGMFQKFHFKPTHHTQTPIDKLLPAPPTPSNAETKIK